MTPFHRDLFRALKRDGFDVRNTARGGFVVKAPNGKTLALSVARDPGTQKTQLKQLETIGFNFSERKRAKPPEKPQIVVHEVGLTPVRSQLDYETQEKDTEMRKDQETQRATRVLSARGIEEVMTLARKLRDSAPQVLITQHDDGTWSLVIPDRPIAVPPGAQGVGENASDAARDVYGALAGNIDARIQELEALKRQFGR